jgi:P-type Mg2+ transporter
MTSDISGLTTAEAQALLQKYGVNTQVHDGVGVWKIVLKQFMSPIVYLLGFAVAVSVFTGDTLNAIILSALVLINSVIGFLQEYQSNKLATQLNLLVTKESLCLRDSKYVYVESSKLVPGDIIQIKLGDLVPADCQVIDSQDMSVDESSFTGEADPVYSKTGDTLLSGSHLVSGSGVVKVTKTGINSAIGRIVTLSVNTPKKSEYNRTMEKLTRGFMVVGFVYLVCIFGLHLVLGKVDDWHTSLIFILALTISIIPEALPIVTSITLSTQAIQLSKKGLLVKHQTVLEDLGNMDILCTDKTGTLTQNIFDVLPGEYSLELLNSAHILSTRSHESFEVAIQKFCLKQGITAETEKVYTDIPFDPQTRISGKKIQDTTYYHGSPSEILNQITTLNTAQKDEVLLEVHTKESNGIKCLSYATKTGDHVDYIGSIYFQDELKKDTTNLIKKYHTLHIAIKVLTGDSLAVAQHIGVQSGLIHSPNEAISAEDIDFNLKTDVLFSLLGTYKIIARCTPEKKYKIIECLQSQLVVGYLGDGINDAPALKSAQIGIVVDTSSAIAKETADIIMTNSDLHNLVIGVVRGRTIFENINKYLKATLSSSFGNFFTMGLLSLILPFTPMLGIQILISNLITDIPLISLSNDTVKPRDIRKPKHQNLPRLILVCFVLGLISSIFDVIFVSANRQLPVNEIQTSWFFFSIITELLILFSVRSRGFFGFAPAPKLNTIIYSALGGIVAIFTSMYLFKVINITTIGISQIAILSGLAILYFVTSETVKVLYYRIYSNDVE